MKFPDHLPGILKFVEPYSFHQTIHLNQNKKYLEVVESIRLNGKALPCYSPSFKIPCVINSFKEV